MKIYGLTGGIGCGKSAVADELAKLGATIIDTDVIARQLVAPGQPALQQIAAHFGLSFLTEDGELNRKKLRQHIFHDKQAKQWLESLLHPLIRETVALEISKTTTSLCILVIPLLFENRHDYPLDGIIVVDCPIEQQIERVMTRDKASKKEVEAIINSQASREMRLEGADWIINNDLDLDTLKQQTYHLFHKL